MLRSSLLPKRLRPLRVGAIFKPTTRLRRIVRLLTGGLLLALFWLSTPVSLERLQPSTIVVDKDDRLLRAFHAADGQLRLPIALTNVDPRYIQLLIAYEDQRYWSHPGVDLAALARALWQNIQAKDIVSGGSTLAMQTARLSRPQARTIWAKLGDIERALRLTAQFGKKGVLQIYVESAPFGGNIAGLRAASLSWFGKEPKSLSLGEIALLIALPQNPTGIRPDRFPDRAGKARQKVLTTLVKRGAISPLQENEALEEPIPPIRRLLPFLSPHLAERLVSIHRQQNGAVIRTSIDASTQQRLEILARDHAKRISDQANVAMIVVESATGAVRAHIGSAGYYETLRQGSVDMTEATRSPGSTLKPFLYAMAFDEDLAAPNTIILDAPTRFGAYAPNNFNAGFAGEISLSAALQHSLNVSSVKLLDAIGPERFAAKLRNSGLHLFFSPGGRPNLTMILGGVGVTLEDLARGYLQLSSYQGPRDLHFVTPVSTPLRQPFAREETLWAISNILREAPAPPGFAVAERVQDFAIKTGTSYGYRDAWAAGWNEDYVVAIWVGRADGAPLADQFGRAAAAPLVHAVYSVLPSPKQRAAPLRAAANSLMRRDYADLPSPLQVWLGDRAQLAEQRENTPLEIIYPFQSAQVDLSSNDGLLALEARGGVKPYTWLINGEPIATEAWASGANWRADGGGAVNITLIDAQGAAVRHAIWLRSP